ncbi:MAG: hypothetical protein NT126_08495 [Bacteroidetes bacterium]|nr:hypothetical protein [Bacteroidota bacterium]
METGKSFVHILKLRNLFSATAFTCILFLMTSCNIINPAEPVPAYVHIDSIPFSATLTEGGNSSKITDAWVYVDGNIVGAFELPATFPVLSSGTHQLKIRPGILIDGIAATRTAYPFYMAYDTTVNFDPGKTIRAMPVSSYTSAANIRLEDFDQSGISLVSMPSSDTSINIVQDANCFYNHSGKVYLDDAHPSFECAWKDSFPLFPSLPAYVELNYFCNNEFTVGLITYTTLNTYSTDIVTYKPTDTWRKEYVNLTPHTGNYTGITGYKFYIKATKATGLPAAILYFDNIKVVN